jgi:hypothetical protein
VSTKDKNTKDTKDTKGTKKKGKAGTYLAIGSTLFAAFSNVKKVRAARSEDDTLLLIDGLIRVAAVATGVALLVRELRQHDNDVLTD